MSRSFPTGLDFPEPNHAATSATSAAVSGSITEEDVPELEDDEEDEALWDKYDQTIFDNLTDIEDTLRDQALDAFKDQVDYFIPRWYHRVVLTDIQMRVKRNKKVQIRSPLQIKQQERSVELETELHIAARKGDAENIRQILHRDVGLIANEDSKGDLPLHEAARAGQLEAVMTLTLFMQELVEPKLSTGKANKEGNTPLHLAVQNGHGKVAWFLIRKEPVASYSLNKDGISPLYLAIEAPFPDVVQFILLCSPLPSNYLDQTSSKKSVVHAAIRARDKEILARVSKKLCPLVNSFDEEGRTPLSYAAYIGYLDGVVLILNKFPRSAFKQDKDGSYPIHRASDRGYVETVEQFLLRFPETLHLLDGRGQNILQVASKSGMTNVVSCLQKMQGINKLMNMKDKDGNKA